MIRQILKPLILLVSGVALYHSLSLYPLLKMERLFFGNILPLFQKIRGLEEPDRLGPLLGFKFEDPKAVAKLKDDYDLLGVVEGKKNDFEKWVALMHWVRDQFPHAIPKKAPPSQAFKGWEVLERKKEEPGFLCGTASQLLVQAITSLGGYARRVELRFTPNDRHAVIEAWSETYRKWVVLDPDYDLFYSVDGIPQHAQELHDLWAKGEIDRVQTHPGKSPNNIYLKNLEDGKRSLHGIYQRKRWKFWDDFKKQRPDRERYDRFPVKLLNYYTQISYPMRNDWASRPLPWWHPEGNHVQNSLVILKPTMRRDDDFLLVTNRTAVFYGKP